MKCIIIEDELPAQQVLLSYIEKTSFIQCIGVYDSITEISHSILQQVDFIFLDIQLPEIDGLTFLKIFEVKPKVIITTAYRDYAIDAFDEAVIDFLLKPFAYERFLKAVIRIPNTLIPLGSILNKDEFFVYADKTFHRMYKNNILFIKAEVDYVYIVGTTKKVLVQDTLSNWNSKLKNSGFIRVHRSYIINFSKIDKIVGNQIFIEEHIIPIGNTYKSLFFKLIKK